MLRGLLAGLLSVLLLACQRRDVPRAAQPAPSLPTSNVVAASTPFAVAGAAATEPSALPGRVYVKDRYVFVRERPDANADWFGFLWFGSSVALRSSAPIAGRGCLRFYAIEPKGYVCVDERQATLRADDAVFKFVSEYAPRLDRAAPHAYAESRGAELLTIVPGQASSWPALPKFFHEPRRRLLPLSTVAYLDEVMVRGEPWLLTADLLWLKKEAVAPYPPISFHGVELGHGVKLPIAFFRGTGSARYRRSADGRFESSGRTFALHEVVALRAGAEAAHGARYFQLLGSDEWVRERDAVFPVSRGFTPWGARVGEADHSGRAPKNARQTWIEVSVLGGWLLAFEGTKAVFATLVSAGRGGIPQAGKNTLEIAATPIGTFPISGKLATVTLQAPGEYVHSDVPWTQNFQKPYAIHSAYWHDNWGNLQSGGCINVSPSDGKWLFDFSEPQLPQGWHAVRWDASGPAPTLLVVHE